MSILIKNRVGQSKVVDTTVSYNQKLSADGAIKFDIIENEYNYDLIRSIAKMWTVKRVESPDDEREFTIIIVDRKTIGNKQMVSVTARQKEVDDLMCSRIHENVTGSLKADQYFNIVFRGTGYKFTVPKGLYSSRFENAGEGETRLEMLKRGMEHYGVEYDYNPQTKTFDMVVQVNKKPSYYISDEINANSIQIEEDSSNIFTTIKGYGDYRNDDDYTKAGLVMELEHPLADVIGKREAPPVKNANITKQDTMRALLESTLNKSNKVSLSVDFIPQKDYEAAKPKVGDVVTVKSKTLGIQDVVRIVEMTTIVDAKYNIVKQDLTLGDFKREDRYIADVNGAANFVGGLGGSIGGNETLRAVQMKINGTASSIKNVVDSTVAIKHDGKGLHVKRDDWVLSILDTQEQTGLFYSLNKGVNYTPIFDKSGFNPNVIPDASPKRKGSMSIEDKKKLDLLEVNDGGLVITDDKGKKYNLNITNGQLSVKEV